MIGIVKTLPCCIVWSVALKATVLNAMRSSIDPLISACTNVYPLIRWAKLGPHHLPILECPPLLRAILMLLVPTLLPTALQPPREAVPRKERGRRRRVRGADVALVLPRALLVSLALATGNFFCSSFIYFIFYYFLPFVPCIYCGGIGAHATARDGDVHHVGARIAVIPIMTEKRNKPTRPMARLLLLWSTK